MYLVFNNYYIYLLKIQINISLQLILKRVFYLLFFYKFNILNNYFKINCILRLIFLI